MSTTRGGTRGRGRSGGGRGRGLSTAITKTTSTNNVREYQHKGWDNYRFSSNSPLPRNTDTNSFHLNGPQIVRDAIADIKHMDKVKKSYNPNLKFLAGKFRSPKNLLNVIRTLRNVTAKHIVNVCHADRVQISTSEHGVTDGSVKSVTLITIEIPNQEDEKSGEAYNANNLSLSSKPGEPGKDCVFYTDSKMVTSLPSASQAVVKETYIDMISENPVDSSQVPSISVSEYVKRLLEEISGSSRQVLNIQTLNRLKRLSYILRCVVSEAHFTVFAQTVFPIIIDCAPLSNYLLTLCDPLYLSITTVGTIVGKKDDYIIIDPPILSSETKLIVPTFLTSNNCKTTKNRSRHYLGYDISDKGVVFFNHRFTELELELMEKVFHLLKHPGYIIEVPIVVNGKSIIGSALDYSRGAFIKYSLLYHFRKLFRRHPLMAFDRTVDNVNAYVSFKLGLFDSFKQIGGDARILASLYNIATLPQTDVADQTTVSYNMFSVTQPYMYNTFLGLRTVKSINMDDMNDMSRSDAIARIISCFDAIRYYQQVIAVINIPRTFGIPDIMAINYSSLAGLIPQDYTDVRTNNRFYMFGHGNREDVQAGHEADNVYADTIPPAYQPYEIQYSMRAITEQRVLHHAGNGGHEEVIAHNPDDAPANVGQAQGVQAPPARNPAADLEN